LVLQSLSIDELPRVTETFGKMMCCGIKIYSANVIFATQCAHQAQKQIIQISTKHLLVWCNLSAWSSFATSWQKFQW